MLRRPSQLLATTAIAAVGALSSPASAATATSPAPARSTAPPKSAPPASRVDRLRSAKTFALALGISGTPADLTRLSHRDLVVVDGEEITRGQLRQIRRRGALVLGYLSVGTVESWRSWFPLLEPHRLAPLGDWPGERYADVRSDALRGALADVIAPQLLAKEFDGLFLDNIDAVESSPEQAGAMLDLVQRISARVRNDGRLLMAQNADSVIADYLPLLDAWNREDPTGTYDVARKRYTLTDQPGRMLARRTLQAVRAAGVVTTTTDYFSSPAADRAPRAVRLACSAGAIPSIAEISLSRVPRVGARCPANPGS